MSTAVCYSRENSAPGKSIARAPPQFSRGRDENVCSRRHARGASDRDGSTGGGGGVLGAGLLGRRGPDRLLRRRRRRDRRRRGAARKRRQVRGPGELRSRHEHVGVS